jgi:hypothetical protein
MCQHLLILIRRQWLIQFRRFRTAFLTTLHGDQRAVESGVAARLYPFSEHNSYYANLFCSCKAIMSPLCNSEMSLSCSNEQREIGHGLGDYERTRAKSH